jgi:hypothetical protein
MMAQATRAVLFAKATAATSLGFRLSKEVNRHIVRVFDTTRKDTPIGEKEGPMKS